MTDAQSQVERAYDQVVVWLEHFEDLDDPRQSGKVAYLLNEMLLQCLLAVLAGADSWLEIALVRQAQARLPSAVRGVRARHAVA